MRNLKKNYFNSIDELPIWNWWRVSETGNYIYLIKDADYSQEDYSLNWLWLQLYDEYLTKYGIDAKLIDVLKLKKKWILTMADVLLNNNRMKLNDVDVIEADMKDLITEDGMSNEDVIIFLETKLNRAINPKELTVSKYMDYIKYFSKK